MSQKKPSEHLTLGCINSESQIQAWNSTPWLCALVDIRIIHIRPSRVRVRTLGKHLGGKYSSIVLFESIQTKPCRSIRTYSPASDVCRSHFGYLRFRKSVKHIIFFEIRPATILLSQIVDGGPGSFVRRYTHENEPKVSYIQSFVLALIAFRFRIRFISPDPVRSDMNYR